MPFTGEQRQILLNVARTAIRAALSQGETRPPAPPATAYPELQRPAGCFVSLHEVETKRLRGCVGRLDARDPLIAAVHESAIQVLSDPRFTNSAVTMDQLRDVELEVTVLSPLKPAAHCLEFEPAIHGIYLTLGARGGCFLPQVARDTGWSRETLLERLCSEKLGLAPEAWKRPEAKLSTFTAEIIGPEPFEPPRPTLDPASQ